MAIVSTGKCSEKVMCNVEYEKFEGVNFTILVCSVEKRALIRLYNNVWGPRFMRVHM